MTTRILITGSRNWRNAYVVSNALAQTIAEHPGPVVVIHGAARGADRLADALAPTFGPHVTVERWAADWYGPCRPECRPGHRRRNEGRTICPAAGHYRNAAMVAAGADVCLAFPLGESRGTRDCMRRAEGAGIRVVDCTRAAAAAEAAQPAKTTQLLARRYGSAADAQNTNTEK